MGLVWPSARLVSLACTGGVALGLSIAISWHGLAAAAIVVSAFALVAATLLTRLAFEGASALRDGFVPRVIAALAAAATGTLAVSLLTWLAGAQWRPGEVAIALPATGIVLLLAAWLRAWELSRQAARRRVFFVGIVDQIDDFAREVAHSRSLSLVASEGLDAHRRRALDREALLSRVEEVNANVIVLSESALADRALADAAATKLNLRGLRVRSLATFYENEFGKVATSELSSSWFLFDVAEIHGIAYRASKRLFEATIAAAILAAAAPAMPLICAAIKRSSPGPLLFRQERVGRNGRIFSVVKFRTMEPDPDRPPGWAEASQMRVFPAGRWLRKFRLDELPQLWNVVRGDLSLVGPRPEQPTIVSELEKSIPFYGKRHVVRPGLTGWAQVNFGYGGSEAGSVTKLQYDLYYVKHQSLRLDWRILLATVRTVIGGTGH